jgi:hypothetical protein
MFLNPKEATLKTWWDDERKIDENISTPIQGYPMAKI